MTEPNAVIDAAEWLVAQPDDVVRMVRVALREEPTPHSLGRALLRAIIATGDECTRTVAGRCEDRDYAIAFAIAVLRAE